MKYTSKTKKDGAVLLDSMEDAESQKNNGFPVVGEDTNILQNAQ